jgi:16S rRNA processing protein RimM
MTKQDRQILVGQFGAAVGIRGELRLKSFTENPLAIARYKSLSLDDGSLVSIRSLREQGKQLVASVKGVTDRSAAEALTGRDLFIARSELPDTEADDEFYFSDLVGLMVRDQSGNETGKVVAVHDFGAGNILEMRFGDGSSELFAFTKAAFPDVRPKDGYLVFVPPPETTDRGPG